MNRTRMIMTVLSLALVVAQPAAADFDAGQRAWDAGNVAGALTQWRAAADAGDRRAMLALGRLHLQGLGVIQDYVEAHKWLNLAASRGEAAALAERDAVAAKMTPVQVAKAQERAAAWRPGASGAEGTTDASAAHATPATSAPDASATQATAATPAPAAAPDADRPPPRAIREAQGLLGALGYRPGPVDGIWGRRTGAAYQAFLRDAGLPAAEILTPEALRAMRAIAERKGVAAAAAPRARSAPSAPEPAALPPETLHQAARIGDIEVLKAALAAGVDVDARDGQGWTALMHVVNKGYPLLVPPLLAAKADPDIRAPDGATALFMAAAQGHTELISMLMKAGASVSIRGPKWKTAVEVAWARFGDADTAREKVEDAAVVALLGGRTWSEAKAAERLARKWPHGKKLRDCTGCPELVVIRSGSYEMGSPSEEDGRYDNEGPVHRIWIAEPFAVGVYEVTRGEWSRFVSSTGYSTGDSCETYEGGEWKNRTGRSWRAPGFAQGDEHPVVCVSFEEAKEYVGWLSDKTGAEYRLLSESEWEYVARGGKVTSRYWGASESGQCGHGNGADRTLKKRYGEWKWTVASCDDGHVYTSPVGMYSSNSYGLHDVLGNVWEWVEDCWHGDYWGAPADGSAWTTRGGCRNRDVFRDHGVFRGGSWSDPSRDLRSANRDGFLTFSRRSYLGFRVARALD